MTELNESARTTTALAPPSSDAPDNSRSIAKIAIALASVWLVISLAVGFALIAGSFNDSAFDEEVETLTSSASYSSYGGDAYTGIQNAAVDTERAVIDGANQLVSLQVVQHRNAMRVQLGLGVLIISVGLTLFVGALQRSAPMGRA